MLFPGADAESEGVAEAVAAAAELVFAERCAWLRTSGGGDRRGGSGDGDGSGGRAVLTVLVPDGSWEQARALADELWRSSAGRLRRVRLGEGRLAAHTSRLIEALRPGSGGGRASRPRAGRG